MASVDRTAKSHGTYFESYVSTILAAWRRRTPTGRDTHPQPFQTASEALAHEHASIVGALGMQVVAEAQGNASTAAEYARLAHEIWRHADPGALERQLARLRKMAGR